MKAELQIDMIVLRIVHDGMLSLFHLAYIISSPPPNTRGSGQRPVARIAV